jgi:hypothetical protein
MQKLGSELEVGDILEVMGGPRRITRLEAYLHPTLRLPGWQIAYADTKETAYKNAWGITIEPQLTYQVS